MVAKMQPHSVQLGLLARELALDIADGAFAPEIVAHLPGIANATADSLSRLLDPLKKAVVPQYLSGIAPTSCPPRCASWYKSRPASVAG